MKFGSPLKLFYIIAFLLATHCVSAQQSGGGYSAGWMYREFSSRTVGMAGVFTSIANDPNAIYYNPAGLSTLPDVPTFITSVGLLGLGRTNSTFAWGQQVADGLGVGVAISDLKTGTFTARNQIGTPYGEYTNFQYAIAASLGYKVGYASFGATIKYLGDELQGCETFANGYAVDFGALFDIMEQCNVGVQIQNASALMFWNTAQSNALTIPWRIKLGLSKIIYTAYITSDEQATITGDQENKQGIGIRPLTLGLQISYLQYSVAPIVSIAAEYEVHPYITLRGGLGIYGDNYGHPEVLPMNHWGTGVSIYPELEILENLPFTFSIDYSVSNELLVNTGINHNLSLTINF